MKLYTKKKFLSSIVFLIISIMGTAQTTPLPKFHDTKGNIDVDGSGQLQFSLPIALPPGVKNVTPQVSLVYTSGASNGIAGYGWNIAGLSSISRTGKNIEKDGEMKGVQLDYSDYYIFDGQRLVLKSGEYGKDGAEYVTEKFSNTKIRSLGTIAGQTWKGPEYWEVTFADGSQAWYGALGSGDSNGRTPLEYNIVKWKDAQGNYITYNYMQSAASNVAVVSSIKWGGNEVLNKPHFNEVLFNYNSTTTRSLVEQSYVTGISFIQDKLLNSIVVKTNNSQYKKYEVIYKSDDTRYQFVDKIQEYNADNEPANPVEFTSPLNYSTHSNISSPGWPNFTNFVLSGDFSGRNTTSFITNGNPLGIGPNGYYLSYDPVISSTEFYLGTENIFTNGAAITIKDANGIVGSRQGIVSYSINGTTNDLTVKYYLVDLSKTIYGQSQANYQNALSLVSTKVIPGNLWNEDEQVFTPSPYNIHRKKTTIKRVIPYDVDGDGVQEVLIEKNIKTTDTWCYGQDLEAKSENLLPPAGTCETISFDESKYIVVKQQDDTFPFFQFNLDKSENLIFGDFNGDGIDDIAKSFLTSGTVVNGESVPVNILRAYNIKKNDQGNLALSEVYSDDYYGLSSQVQIGDFNGDGISDLFVRTNTNDHYFINLSTGKNFVKLPYFNDFIATSSYTSSQAGNYLTAKVLDINKDGKSDIVNFSTYYNISSPNAHTSIVMYVSENHGYLNGRVQFESNELVTYGNSGAYIYREVLGIRQNEFYIYSPSNTPGEGTLFPYEHYSNLRNKPIDKVKQAGFTTLIGYSNSFSATQNGYYNTVQPVQYPLMELGTVNSNVVTHLSESDNQPNVSRIKLFRYRGLVINLHNKKSVGFRQMASSSWNSKIYPTNNFVTTYIWSGTETDPLKEGVPVKEWSIRTNDESKVFPSDLSENNPQLLSFKSTTYQIDKLVNGQVMATIPAADKPKVITAILPKTSRGKDFLTGAVAENTITYGDYYLPSQSVAKINTSYGITTSTYQYSHNAAASGANYYIGRLVSKSDLIQAYGDSKNSKQEYTYQNNLIKTIKTWNRDNTAYNLDTFSYDDFGNVTQKVSGNSINSQTITSGYGYDSKGRFLIKQTDNLNLETNTIYNDLGQVLTETDPFGITVNNTYDAWGKILTSSSNVGGTTSYQYEREDNYNSIFTQNDPDGDVSKKYINVLGQNYKTSVKAFAQGQYVSRQSQFDGIGRKIKESEPYFEGQNVSQWNAFVYDDTVYPAKITATAFNGKQTTTTVSGLTTTIKEINGYARTTSKTADALGNIISTTDKGGTIQFSYNAAGEQIQAKYAENAVTTKYDSWGRKVEFNDPSNGVYTYKYDPFGRLKLTASPKGIKDFTYNDYGQLVSQYEFSEIDGGQTTDKTILFKYDPKGLLTEKSGFVKGKAFISVFNYDEKGRLISSVEDSNERTYAYDKVQYDNKGRVVSYIKSLKSPGGASSVAVENVYSAWNGELYQIKNQNSGKALWELKEANARGQVLKSKLGAAEINNSYDANGYLTNINHSSIAHPGILQISYAFNAIKNELVSRTTGGDLNITESFDYDDNNRLVNWTDPVTGIKPSANRNTYDVKGRILENDQVGTIKFENSATVYQATSMELNSNGAENYNKDLIQKIVYNENNDPVYINGERGDVLFQYGLTDMRQRVTYGGQASSDVFPENEEWQGKFTKYYNEDGSFEVIVNNEAGGTEKHILYIGGNPYEANIVYLKEYDNEKGAFKFLHKDYLGSILAISDEAGNKLEQRHFDGWGNLTHLQVGNGGIIVGKENVRNFIAESGGLLIDRGYTSHEHFFDVGIIHMNGRLYDPLLRRFLNADENIQDPTNTQNYNKYGYVMNNPMMYSDPSGEFWAWFIGAVVGSYLSGVQANNGNFNPVKWDWGSTWTAVVGGAFAGAAIGGAIQNISVSGTKFIQNSVVGAVGSIFNGVATGQNVFKSALVGLSGINASFSLGSNSIASNDGINAGYRYIISPEESLGGGWEDLTKSILLNYVQTNFCPNCSYGTLQRMAGLKFEAAFNAIMGLDLASFNYLSNDQKIAGMYKGRSRGTIPDGVYDLVRDEVEYRKDNFRMGPFNIRIPIPTGLNTKRYSRVQYAEVKAMDGTLYTSSNQGQLSAMITSMHTNNGVYSYGGQFLIGTTSDTVISPSIYTLGASFGKGKTISIIHMTSQYRMISGGMQIRFTQGWMSSPTSTTYLK
ncbi:FG-GAP-like repeat-containing protein [Chryseobacterium takakiae]|uniref:RHS repeat-associated core domain-containing protein n=1 Tax=Chryseobacterium takakiae TaxID=1302685 RepID=A0A1M5AUI9_9FLAO|nr:FG-GAP-like repeat-containing protein [Chryseobacterium takakiae]SHF33884.1 RHS repeat-associated core domain-containing protein [Chryseobacterium takakiae]